MIKGWRERERKRERERGGGGNRDIHIKYWFEITCYNH